MPTLHASSRLKSILPSHLHKICMMLDPLNEWKELAARIRNRNGNNMFDNDQVLNIDYMTSRSGSSPTKAILTSWFTDNPTIGDLREIMRDIKNYRVLKFITLDILGEPYEHIEVHDDFNTPPTTNTSEGSNLSLHQGDETKIVDVRDYGRKSFYIPYTTLEIATEQFDPRPLIEGGRFIGQGAFGQVFFGEYEGYPNMAVKKFQPFYGDEESTLRKQFVSEISVLTKCFHENLVPLIGCCDAPVLCIVYEFMANGSLEDRLARKDGTEILSVTHRLRLSKEIAKGLSYLHGRDPPLIHRDIKSANILLDKNWTAKIGDCGTVREGPCANRSVTFTQEAIGTLPYMAPEYINDGKVSALLDSYSYGVVLLEILTSLPVFDRTREDSALPTHVREATVANSIYHLVDHEAGNWGQTLPDKMYSLIQNFLDHKSRRKTVTEAIPIIDEWTTEE